MAQKKCATNSKRETRAGTFQRVQVIQPESLVKLDITDTEPAEASPLILLHTFPGSVRHVPTFNLRRIGTLGTNQQVLK